MGSPTHMTYSAFELLEERSLDHLSPIVPHETSMCGQLNCIPDVHFRQNLRRKKGSWLNQYKPHQNVCQTTPRFVHRNARSDFEISGSTICCVPLHVAALAISYLVLKPFLTKESWIRSLPKQEWIGGNTRLLTCRNYFLFPLIVQRLCLQSSIAIGFHR